MTDLGKNMLLYTSYWRNADTFKLLPVTVDCPFVEVIYDPATTLLVVISKNRKENLQFIPRLDENGDVVRSKVKRADGKDYKEQRISMELFQEYYLVNKAEQEAFIQKFAINAESYDYAKYLRDVDAEAKNPIQPVETPGLVDANGIKLEVVK